MIYPTPTPTPGTIAFIEPVSVSFVDSLRGWVVGSACDAHNNCRPGVAKTTDGGLSWAELPPPPSRPTSEPGILWPSNARIVFTSPQDGWVFGPFLAKTTDGGLTWQSVNLPTADPVTDVFAFNGAIWALTGCDLSTPCPTRLWQTKSVGESFTLWIHQPPSISKAAALVAGPALVLYGSDREQAGRFVLTTDGTTWQTRASPCALSTGLLGSSPLGMLMDVCGEPVGGGWEPKEVWTSVDSGAHWTLRSRSPQFNSSLRAVGTLTDHGYPNGIAMPTSRDAWMSMGRDDLYETHDAGVTWVPSAVPGQFGGDAAGSEDVLFVDALHGWALGADGLYRTADGRHWSRSPVIGPVPGYSF